MLTELTFCRNQVRAVELLMEKESSFRPDDCTLEQVAQLLAEGDAANDDYVERWTAWESGKSDVTATREDLHEVCVAVTLALRSAYRKDAVSLDLIRRLPKRDQTAAQTLARGEALVRVWQSLLPPPGHATSFKLGPLDGAALAAQVTAFVTSRAAAGEAERAFQEQQAKTRAVQRKLEDFAKAAFAQGRALFHADPVQLHAVMRFPRRRSTPAPPPPKNVGATSPHPGAVRVEGKARHATSFEVWQRGPGEKEFQRVAVVKVRETGALVWEASGLAPGEYAFQIAGVNSRGTGRRSEAVMAGVAQQAAA